METLLIAIESEIIRTALAQKLSQHKVYTCDTGAAMLAALEMLHPNIFILDLTLLGIDGLEALRKSDFKPRVVLALTTFVSDSVLQAAAAAGVQDVLLLPCAIRCIIKHLDALTEKVPSPEI